MRMKRVQGGWVPAENEASAYTIKTEHGEEREFTVVKKRNAKFSSKFWAMVDLVAANQDKINFSTVKQGRERMIFAACLILRLGEFWGKNKEHFERKSFAFANMKEDEFAENYNQILDVYLKHFVPMNKEDFERELMAFV